MELRYISTKKQIIDSLTKLLYRDIFQAFRKIIRIK
jgi:hypothetical protein